MTRGTCDDVVQCTVDARARECRLSVGSTVEERPAFEVRDAQRAPVEASSHRS